MPPPSIDWQGWVRHVERKRRMAGRPQTAGTGRAAPPPRPSPAYYAAATASSFRLEGLHVDESDLKAALCDGAAARSMRSRQAKRVRNHVAILRHVEAMIARGQPLKPADVVRWYTSVACGLSTTSLDGPTVARLEQVVRQVNSPHLRLQPAVTEIARLHLQLLRDPLVPGFNGILARLLLRYHLGRCGLPPVVFDPALDGRTMAGEGMLLPRLMELVIEAYETGLTT